MISVTFFIVSITMIVSLFYYKKFKNTLYIYFVYYVFFAFITESINAFRNIYYMITDVLLYPTNPIYNIYIILTFIFYFIFYKKLFKNNRNKKIMNAFIIFYFIYILFDFFILKVNLFLDFFVNNIVFGSILLVITLILFLVEIINNEEIVFNIKKSLIFWISIGALLFYIGVIPIIISSEYLNFKGLYHTILTPLNIIMYGSFIIGFIKSDPKYNY